MLKKYIAAILSVITIISIIAVPVCASETMYVCNVKDSVYLRKSPGSGSYYTTIPVGTAVTSLGWQKGSDGIGYNQVLYNGQKGWVKSEYLSKARNNALAGETVYIANVKNSVYLRKSPGSGSYYTTIPVGTAVLSIGWQKGSDGIGYNQVVYNGQKGWVKSEYIKKSSSSNVVTSAEQAKQIVRQRKKLSGNYTITAKDMGSYYLVNVKKSGSEYSCHVSKETGAISNEAGGGV